jgi:hypothetical protein
MRERVLIIVNKWWECDPILGALLNDNARPTELGWPDELKFPHRRPNQGNIPPKPSASPRAVFTLSKSKIEIWCISDLLEDLPDKPAFQSSSEKKMERLSLIPQTTRPQLVVAVGTASFPSQQTQNGSVVCGTNIYMHNFHPAGTNPDSNWEAGPFDQLITSKLSPIEFARITNIPIAAVANRFMLAPSNPATGTFVPQFEATGLCTVNVTDYNEYTKADGATWTTFQMQQPNGSALSLETTHGLIRETFDSSFCFVSGITDRTGYFDTEVSPSCAQRWCRIGVDDACDKLRDVVNRLAQLPIFGPVIMGHSAALPVSLPRWPGFPLGWSPAPLPLDGSAT